MSDKRDQFADLTTVRMCFRDEGDPDGEPLLLIMGLSSQLIHWPQEIVDALGERGYRVIRPDNRDSGLTEWKTTPSQYYLRAIARDTVELLDHLGIEQAHVVGASMGGMVAQLLAIEYAPRVLSLCSIMSTPHIAIGMADGNVLEELTKPLPPVPRTRSSRSPACTRPSARRPMPTARASADSRWRRRPTTAHSTPRAEHAR